MDVFDLRRGEMVTTYFAHASAIYDLDASIDANKGHQRAIELRKWLKFYDAIEAITTLDYDAEVVDILVTQFPERYAMQSPKIDAPIDGEYRVIAWDIDDETGARSIRDILSVDLKSGDFLKNRKYGLVLNARIRAKIARWSFDDIWDGPAGSVTIEHVRNNVTTRLD